MLKHAEKKSIRRALFTLLILGLSLVGRDAFAYSGSIGGVTVNTNGWSSLGANQVFIDTSKITLDKACTSTYTASDCATVTTVGGVEMKAIRTYTVEEMENGTFDSERSTAVSIQRSYHSGNVIVIKKNTISAMTNAASPPRLYGIGNGTYFKIRWPKAAWLKNDDNTIEYYDVEMTCDNISAYISGSRSSAISIFWKNWHQSFNTLQEHPASDLKKVDNGYAMTSLSGYYDGVEYDVTIKLYKTGTNTLIDSDKSAMAMSFSDLDARDTTIGASNPGVSTGYWETTPTTTYPYGGGITLNIDRTGAGNRHLRQNGKPNRFTESIAILSGLKENKVYSYNTNNETSNEIDDEEGTYLYFSETDSNNLRISATTATNNDGSGEPGTNTSRFLTLVDGRGFKYHWSGSSCGTQLGFIGKSTVTTGTVGDYANKLTITESDSDVLWRQTKTINIDVQSGYRLSSVRVDGRSVNLSQLTRSGNTWSYTFNEVVEDHSIIVSAAPLEFNFCKVDMYTGDVLPGATLMLRGVDSSNGNTLSFEPNVYSQIENLGDSEKIQWLTDRNCITLYALPDGRYVLSELVAPPDYTLADNITFEIVNGSMANVQPSSALTGNNTITMVDEEGMDGGIEIEKIARGTGADLNKSFTINFKITNADNYPNLDSITYKKYPGGYETTAYLDNNSSFSFTLKPGEHISFPLYSGCTYQIQESDYSGDGYTTTYVNQTGVISGGGSYNSAQVINTKNSPTITGIIFSPQALPFIGAGMIIAGSCLHIIRRTRQTKA